ncbi:tripartite motif-containing protein 10-like [Heteronotia binoei]|uniref:tripartite motif-containing protein 10-like n=1 Tax=Heteronotia binoei TaxID=13085 RepID=UPI002931080E|nr:tripartite motif-containing protein 10-like [Heteronotia binoei]XP_060094587.1 tripartite motif-containing protein 10-like [Heteronotia binoei]
MASAPPSIEIEQEANCPICLECLTDPVVLDCGHSFCQACITDYCEKWETLGDLECPVCKFKFEKGAFRRNWQLANLVEKIKLVPRSSRKGLCLRHQEKLHFFCKKEEKLVCFVCKRSPEHQGHTIISLEVAAKKYKDQFCNRLEILKKERERIVAYKGDVEKESQDVLKHTEKEKQATLAKFRQLHTFLEQQEKFLLAQMEEVEKEVARNRDQHLNRISEELSSLESLIQEMEEKCQQPASDLLQDVRSTLQRYEDKESFESPVAIPLALKWHIWDFSDLNLLLKSIKKQLKANVILDPDTAHPSLILSKGQKRVRRGEAAQVLPNNPERFDCYDIVLGCEGFTGGCHFWEVLVGSGPYVASILSCLPFYPHNNNDPHRYEDKESFENPVAIPLALKWHIWDFSDFNLLLEGIKKQLKDTLDSGLHPQKANVILDPDTAYKRLILSEGQKSVRRGEEAQVLPNKPERFESHAAVLGCEGFTGGCHFWEVLVGSEEEWAVGVARKSVKRKGGLTFTPVEGIWAVGKCSGMHKAYIKKHYPPLTVIGELKRIRVCLNYAGGRVAFFDADRAALLYEFSGASFHGETLLPFFWVYKKGHLQISS